MNYYCDIRLIPVDRTIPDIMGKLIKCLHECDNDTYSLAFPEIKTGSRPLLGRILRVFHDSYDELDALIGQVESAHKVSGYIAARRVKPVPEVEPDQYCVYQHLKIKTTRSINATQNEYIKKKQIAKRDNDFKSVESLPFVTIRSNSNGNPMTISVQPMTCRKDDYSEGGKTNSYGLSTSSRKVPVPCF